MTDAPELSVIVPFYNEEESIGAMHAAIVKAIEPLAIPFEMVFVDDGSKDRTLEVATGIARGDERVRVVKFRRNYGQTPAMAAGIEQARGRVLVTMDGDLQNDPQDIEHFLTKINEGHDIVVGWRFNRQDKLISRKIPSKIANWLIGKVTGVPIKDNGCSLKAYRGELIKAIPLYSEMHRFIPAMASIAGPRIAEIKVRHHARQFGASKYGLSRIYKVLLDLMVIKTVASFTARPLIWFSMLATPLVLLGTFALGYALWAWAATDAGMPLPIAGTGVLLVTSAFILVCGGVLGELIYRAGDVRDQDFSRLTGTVWSNRPNV
jgi:glycosyltransferase involved in cell wall biosynthesis